MSKHRIEFTFLLVFTFVFSFAVALAVQAGPDPFPDPTCDDCCYMPPSGSCTAGQGKQVWVIDHCQCLLVPGDPCTIQPICY